MSVRLILVVIVAVLVASVASILLLKREPGLGSASPPAEGQIIPSPKGAHVPRGAWLLTLWQA